MAGLSDQAAVEHTAGGSSLSWTGSDPDSETGALDPTHSCRLEELPIPANFFSFRLNIVLSIKSIVLIQILDFVN